MAVYTSAAGAGLWSAGTTWVGGIKPPSGAGHSIVIASTSTVTYDEAAGEYGNDTTTAITINGVLKASRTTNTSLTCNGQIFTAATTTATIDWGRMSTSDPIPAGITATIILNKSASMANFKYGLFIADTSNGYFCGATKTNNAKLTASLAASGTSVTVDDATGWNIGDTIVFAQSDGTTNHYDKTTISTITPGSGTTATITFPAVTYAHAIGCPIGNITSNVTIKNFNTTNPSYICFRHTSTASNNRREMDYVSLQYIASNSSAATSQVFVSSGSSSLALITPFVTCSHNTVYNAGNSPALFLFNWNSGGFYLDNWSFFYDNGSTGNPTYTAQGTFVGIKNSVYYYSAAPAHASAFSQGGQGCLFTDNIYCATTQSHIQISNGDGALFTRCLFHSSPTLLLLNSGSGNFVNCNFGYTGSVTSPIPSCWGTPSTTNIVRMTTGASKGEWNATDCYFITPSSSFCLNSEVATANPQWIFNVINKNLDSTAQESYNYSGVLIRDNSVYNRSTSNIRYDSNVSVPGTTTTTTTFLATSGVPYTVLGYLRKNSTYGATNLPNVSLSGASITPSIFTMTNSVDTWEKFTLTGTQTTGSPANITFTFNASSTAADGKAYLDGIIKSPFILSKRHYSYIFDNNVYVTSNPIITQTTEATVGAYTGITINHGTQTLTISSTHTIREIYDYVYYDLCQTSNLSYSEWFTSTDGTNFSCTYDIVNNSVITGTGTVTTTGTYTGSGTSSVIIVDSTGTFNNITITGLIANSRVRVNNYTDNIELYNAVVAGTSVTIPSFWTTNKTLDVRVTNVSGTTAYLPYQAAGTLTSTGASFLIAQELDSVYDTNAINGSTVTEFITDYPNIQIDIDDGDGSTSVQRLYAWFQNATHTSQGIIYYFNGITAQDTLNYQVNTNVVDLEFDNVSATSMPIKITGAYIYRDDGTTVIYSGSKSIQMDPARAYGVGASGLTTEEHTKLFSLENSTGGGGFSSQAIQTSISNAKKAIIEKIEEIKPTDLTEITSKLNETNSHIDIAKEDIIDTIKEIEIEICSDVIRTKTEIKKDNVSTRQLVRQKAEKIDKNVSKLSDRQDLTDKMIEDEADELEDQIEALYEKEADDLEKEIDDKFNEEFDQIESEINQLTNGNN